NVPAALAIPVQTITAFRAARSPGDAHAYYSEGDYWWPDPANPAGPYIRRDGFSNPNRFDDHRQALIRLSLAVPALVAAYAVTGEQRLRDAAMAHLTAWFVDPATRMAPHLEHAQAIIGVNTGRGIGIIDTLHLAEVALAVDALRRRDGDDDALRAIAGWFDSYLHWLRTSANGIDEADEINNHGTCYVLQCAAFARLTGRRAVADWARTQLTDVLIPTQIAPDGSQPLELARTKPFGYCLFNLDVMAGAIHLLGDGSPQLWHARGPASGSPADALSYMAPFIADKSRWPHARDVEYWENWPVRHPSLLIGGMALGRTEYIALWSGLDPHPTLPEIIRNYPLRQPLLWV
ncbi:MAG: alginate lyase family protein, partial [Sphingomonadales bacterium]|nr:alginate lyase family protein [Sphingomonadales bacterium]